MLTLGLAVLLNDRAFSPERGEGQGSCGNEEENLEQGHLLLNADLKSGQDVDDIEIAVGDRN